jgi:hypothetical protein
MRLKQVLLILIAVSGYFTFYTQNVSASFVHVKQPLISNVQVVGITSDSATILWLSANSANSQVEYGTTTNYSSLTTLNPALTRSHIQLLNGLTPNTFYHFSVMSRTAAGTLYTAGDFTFSTPPNIVVGMISGLNVSGISATSAIISWTTATPSNSLVEFGYTIGYGQYSPLAPAFVTSHAVVLSGLAWQSPYHFRARSTDAAGNLGISADSTFTTAEPDNPAIFGGIFASAISSTSATITWTTTSPTNSQVDYGTGPGYGKSTAVDPTFTTSHSQTLVGLTPNALYHYRVKSTDGGGNSSISSDYTFSTLSISLFYPQLGADPDTYTGVAISNLDTGSAQLSFTAFGATGSEILASNLANPVSKTLGAGAQMAVIQNQLFGSGVSSAWPLGWTMVNGPTPQLRGFFLTFNSSLSFMDGAELASNLLTSFVLPETGSQDYTTLLIANPNPEIALLTIDLVSTDGTVRSSIQTSIPSYGTYSADLLTATFAGVDTNPSDYVRVVSSQGLLPYEFFGNISKDVAVLAGQDLNAGSTTLYSPQYVAGGGLNSSLSIVNLDSTSGTVTLTWFKDDGSQISTKGVSINANGKIYVSDPSFFLGSSPIQTTAGYVKVTSSGVRLSGNVVFFDAINGIFSTALPLVSTLQQSVVLSHVASNASYFTGLAILNPNSADTTVQIQLYTAAGQLDTSVTKVIPAGHRISQVLTEYFPALAGQDRTSGYIKVIADNGIASFGVFGTTSLSVLSAIPAQPAP